MNWELDLWGRVRYGRAAAAADALSVQADFEFARQSIAAQVAKAWFLAIEAGLQAEVARRAITDSESLVNLAAVRVKVGAGNEEDLYVARASVGSYRDALRDIELAREQALRSLELLIGRYPSGTAAVSPALPGQPDAAPGGLPSALLERRPDVIAAERRVAAAFNRMARSTGRAPPGPLDLRRDQLDYQRPVRARGPGEIPAGATAPAWSRRSFAAARSRPRWKSARRNRSRRWPRTRMSDCARSARSNRRWPRRSPRAIAKRSSPRPCQTISARCRWCRPSSRSAAPIFDL